MQNGVAQVLAHRNSTIQPAHLPLLMALAESGAITIGALGAQVGISQPGVSRALLSLEGAGFVQSLIEGKDRRQRQIDLTKEGLALIIELQDAVFPAVRQAVEQLCGHASPTFLADIGQIEDGLRQEPLDARIRRASQGAAHE